MSKPVSFTPPGVPEPLPGRVAYRHVFYLPGYDPEARSRYRLLFVRELTRYAKVFGQSKRAIGRAETSADGLVQHWDIAAHPETGGAQTTYDVLLWDDIVARDFARSKFTSAALLVAGTVQTAANGLLAAFYRLHWKYGNVIVYPFVMLILLALAAGLVAVLVHAALGEGALLGQPLPPLVTLPLGLLVGLVGLKAAEGQLNRIYFWQLLNDWVFNWQHGQGWRPDYEARLDQFCAHILARLAAIEAAGRRPDEILIIGHSSGALTAVELAARLVAHAPGLGTGSTGLGLVTLGSGLPLVALQKRGRRLREEIARLATCRRIAWVDYGAPQDWLNFPGFNPIRALDLDLPPDAVIANPIVRSARFRDIITPETYAKVRFRPFRMHFQFLMSNDRPGFYDYFDLVLGPRRLLERIHEPDAPDASDLPRSRIGAAPQSA